MADFKRSFSHPEWDSWDADVAEANANVQEEKTHNKPKRQRTTTYQGKKCGWETPKWDLLGREYWTWRRYRSDGSSGTHRVYTDASR